MNHELNAKIDRWRQQAAEGTLSIADMREAIVYLRAGRNTAGEKAKETAAKKKKAFKEILDADDLLEGL